jgi:DNA-binding transcriptional regulator YiaG
MTPAELRQARRELGLSAAKLAAALRLGADGGRTVRRWEAGGNPIPGPAQVAVEMMLAMARARPAGEG